MSRKGLNFTVHYLLMSQVEVLVNKIPSSCPQDNCNFNFSDSITPKVFPFTQVGLSGDTLAIHGTQFGSNPSQIMVQIGSASCPVITANNSYITCTVGSNPAGMYNVIVSVNGVGLAQGKGSFVYRLVASSISPMSGSVGGGEAIHITGSSFNPFGPLNLMNAYQYWNNITIQYSTMPIVPNNTNTAPQTQAITSGNTTLPMFVLIGQELCAISEATNTDITCYVKAVPHQPGLVNVTVVIGTQQATVPISFEFSISRTPMISQVQPTQGSVLGGTNVTISGSNLLGNVQVSIGGSSCTVVSVSEDQISCLTAPLPPGLYPILVSVNDSGIAVLENATAASPFAVYQYQLEINRVSPQLSSVLGGQLVAIEGQGFGSISNTVVTIGGQMCSVVSVTWNKIDCITPTSAVAHNINYLPNQAGKPLKREV